MNINYIPSAAAAISMALDLHLSHLICTFITIFCCTINLNQRLNKLINSHGIEEVEQESILPSFSALPLV